MFFTELPYHTDKSSHRRPSIKKKLFLKVSQYLQENACAEVLFK